MANAFVVTGMALLCIPIAGCRRPVSRDYSPEFGSQSVIAATLPQYSFGVQPMHTTRRMWERYSTLIDCLNSSVTGFQLRLVSAQTDETYNRKLRDGMLDVAIVEPNRVLEAEPLGYRTIARGGKADRIAGKIVILRDSPIERIADLKGKTLAFSSPDSLAGTMMVRMYLHEARLDPDRWIKSKYVGSQESALVEVATHGADAAGVSRDGWHQFREQNYILSERLEAKWETEELPGAAVMVGPHLSPEDVKQVQRSLLRLARTPAGRAALANAGFSEFRYGEEASYDQLWEFLTYYDRVCRRSGRPHQMP